MDNSFQTGCGLNHTLRFVQGFWTQDRLQLIVDFLHTITYNTYHKPKSIFSSILQTPRLYIPLLNLHLRSRMDVELAYHTALGASLEWKHWSTWSPVELQVLETCARWPLAYRRPNSLYQCAQGCWQGKKSLVVLTMDERGRGSASCRVAKSRRARWVRLQRQWDNPRAEELDQEALYKRKRSRQLWKCWMISLTKKEKEKGGRAIEKWWHQRTWKCVNLGSEIFGSKVFE